MILQCLKNVCNTFVYCPNVRTNLKTKIENKEKETNREKKHDVCIFNGYPVHYNVDLFSSTTFKSMKSK